MPSKIVPLVIGETYHIFNRGTDKRDIFVDKGDYVRFYESLYLFNTIEPVINFRQARYALSNRLESDPRKKLVEFKAYALLPNHFHFLLVQSVDGGISEFMKRISVGYTNHFNDTYKRSGVLFQGKFKRVHIEDDKQYQYLFAYINENHIVHGVERPNEVMYSSSVHYQRIHASKLILDTHLYNVKESQLLAHDIHKNRLLQKVKLHE